MAYTVEVPLAVEEYIRNREGLTVADQDRILLGIVDELENDSDQFIQKNPHPLNPDLFWFDFILMTEAHVVREFRFWCDGKGSVFGVIEVRYGEEFLADDGEPD